MGSPHGTPRNRRPGRRLRPRPHRLARAGGSGTDGAAQRDHEHGGRRRHHEHGCERRLVDHAGAQDRDRGRTQGRPGAQDHDRGRTRASDAGQAGGSTVTASASTIGTPVGIILRAVLGGLLLVLGLFVLLARFMGWGFERWQPTLHTWREAGYQTENAISEFGDWTRLGR